MAKKTEQKWKVVGGRPSAEAVVRAALVLLNRPPVIPADVLAEIRREEAERPERKLKTA